MDDPGWYCPPLPAAVIQEQVENAPSTDPADGVKKNLLDIAAELVGIHSLTNLLGLAPTDPYRPSLQTLYKRLQAGYCPPSPLLEHSDNEEEYAKRSSSARRHSALIARPLEDFEDLYYAIVASIKDMHQQLKTRLDNGFNAPDTPLFPGAAHTIYSFQGRLFEVWVMINEPSLVKALDDVTRRSRVEHMRQELISKVEDGRITQQEFQMLYTDLDDPDKYADTPGLQWLMGWSTAMISATLEEKYRVVLQEEGGAQEKVARRKKKREKLTKGGKVKGKRGRSAQRRMEQEQLQLHHKSAAVAQPAMSGQSQYGENQPYAQSEAWKVMQQQFGYPDGTQGPQQEGSSGWQGLHNHGYAADAQQHYELNARHATLPGPAYANWPTGLDAQRFQVHTPDVLSAVAFGQPGDQHTQSPYQQGQADPNLGQEQNSPINSDWHTKMHRVSQYSQWLRGTASEDARWKVRQTTAAVQQSVGNAGAGVDAGMGEDVEMDVDDGAF